MLPYPLTGQVTCAQHLRDMARVPTSDRTPLAQWLIRARESQGITADAFLAQLAAEAGSAPSRPNYAQWESGAVTPRQSNLEPVIRFWAARGINGPDAKAPTADDSLAAAIRDQSQAIRENTAAVQQLLALLLPLAVRGIELGGEEEAK
jgi:transcriptional regulator with XRE-family HTH domain